MTEELRRKCLSFAWNLFFSFKYSCQMRAEYRRPMCAVSFWKIRYGIEMVAYNSTKNKLRQNEMTKLYMQKTTTRNKELVQRKWKGKKMCWHTMKKRRHSDFSRTYQNTSVCKANQGVYFLAFFVISTGRYISWWQVHCVSMVTLFEVDQNMLANRCQILIMSWMLPLSCFLAISIWSGLLPFTQAISKQEPNDSFHFNFFYLSVSLSPLSLQFSHLLSENFYVSVTLADVTFRPPSLFTNESNEVKLWKNGTRTK